MAGGPLTLGVGTFLRKLFETLGPSDANSGHFQNGRTFEFFPWRLPGIVLDHLVVATARPPTHAWSAIGFLIPRDLRPPLQFINRVLKAGEFALMLGMKLILDYEHGNPVRGMLSATHQPIKIGPLRRA
jgi:hypothetical protein